MKELETLIKEDFTHEPIVHGLEVKQESLLFVL